MPFYKYQKYLIRFLFHKKESYAVPILFIIRENILSSMLISCDLRRNRKFVFLRGSYLPRELTYTLGTVGQAGEGPPAADPGNVRAAADPP